MKPVKRKTVGIVLELVSATGCDEIVCTTARARRYQSFRFVEDRSLYSASKLST